MNRIKCCEKCEKRAFKCHKTCTEYATEKTVIAILEVERNKENQLRDDSWSISARRAKKQAGNWKRIKKDKRLGQK